MYYLRCECDSLAVANRGVVGTTSVLDNCLTIRPEDEYDSFDMPLDSVSFDDCRCKFRSGATIDMLLWTDRRLCTRLCGPLFDDSGFRVRGSGFKFWT